MSQPPATPGTWTYEDYARLPDDGNRYEVLDGEVLVTLRPSTLHQHVLLRLAILLQEYIQKYEFGALLPEVDLLFQPGQFLAPDLLFVPNARRAGIVTRGVESAPGLVVEVLSPSSSSIDRVKKPRRYGDFGVPEYRVVDPRERVVWVWKFAESPHPQRMEERVIWKPDAAVEGLVIERDQLFLAM